jgi:transposase
MRKTGMTKPRSKNWGGPRPGSGRPRKLDEYKLEHLKEEPWFLPAGDLARKYGISARTVIRILGSKTERLEVARRQTADRQHTARRRAKKHKQGGGDNR